MTVITLSLGIAGMTLWFGRAQPVSVKVAEVERGMVQETVANTRAGTIKVCRRSGLSPSIGGQIVRMPVKEGDRVKKGQVLLEFWNDDLAAQLVLAQRQTKAAEARVTQACVLADTSRRESKRLQELLEKKLELERLLFL